MEYPVVRKDNSAVGANIIWRSTPPKYCMWRGQLFTFCRSFLGQGYYHQVDHPQDVVESQVNYTTADPNVLTLFE